MAIRQIRIGPAENVVQYDDSDFSTAADFGTESIGAGEIVLGTMPTVNPPDINDLPVFRDVSTTDDDLSTCTFAQLLDFLGARLIDTGTYTGDGTTSQGITGVGFEPKIVIVASRQTSGGVDPTLMLTWSQMIDDNASGMVYNFTTNQTQIDAIISLDSDGFTVDDAGTDSHPNQNGVTYNYIAIGY